MPALSVIVPFQNAEKTLADSVESIRSQSLLDWELILVDDHSTDSSKELALSFAVEDQRIKVYDNPGYGIVDALNFAIASSKTKTIARMDADDLSHPGRLEKQFRHLMQNPRTGLVSCLVQHFKTGDFDDRGMMDYVSWVNSLIDAEEIYLNRFVESPLSHPTVMFRKKLVELHGGYRNGDFPEDYELWLRWLEKGVRMEKVPEVLLHWRDSGQRLSRIDNRYCTSAFFKIKTEYLIRMLQREVEMPLWIWGAGRLSRKRASLLDEGGIEICGYIDIVRKKNTPYPCVHFSKLPPPGNIFVLSYVTSRGATNLIRSHLEGRGYSEGLDFLMVG